MENKNSSVNITRLHDGFICAVMIGEVDMIIQARLLGILLVLNMSAVCSDGVSNAMHQQRMILESPASTELQRIEAINVLRLLSVREESAQAEQALEILESQYESFNDVGRRAIFEAVRDIARTHGAYVSRCIALIHSWMPGCSDYNSRWIVHALVLIALKAPTYAYQLEEIVCNFLVVKYPAGYSVYPEYCRQALCSLIDARRRMRTAIASLPGDVIGGPLPLPFCLRGSPASHLYPV
jgi:hypothetical protein